MKTRPFVTAGDDATQRFETYFHARFPVRALIAKKTPALFAK